MNSALLLLIGTVLLFIGYKCYGTLIENTLIAPSDENKTPAQQHYDGIDFYPAKLPMLFGHHFSSIAGAGPIVGPLLAVSLFGWAGVFVWIVFGSIFIGAVHDYLSLMISVRNDGESISTIAAKYISRNASIVFSLFLWLALILIIAVFALTSAKTYIASPVLGLPSLGLIAIALLLGTMVYRLNFSAFLSTIISLILLVISIRAGYLIPISIDSEFFWVIILLIYAAVASLLPVWILLQPRDYISTFILYAGLIIGTAGIVISGAPINAPAFTGFFSEQGMLWPTLFIIVACGAISGFHSICASGTTSKQLAKESQGKLIGFGAMIMEAFLGLISLIVAAAGLYWLSVPEAHLSSGLILQNALKDGAIVAFSRGFGQLVSSLPFVSETSAAFLGMFMVNAFVLTTLDTATRLGRFVLSEVSGNRINKYWSTLITLLLAAYLSLSGSYQSIWPLFASANQLIAALALLVISSYLLINKKKLKYTVIPAILMLITTDVALLEQIYRFTFITFAPALSITALLLLSLSLFMTWDTALVFKNMLQT